MLCINEVNCTSKRYNSWTIIWGLTWKWNPTSKHIWLMQGLSTYHLRNPRTGLNKGWAKRRNSCGCISRRRGWRICLTRKCAGNRHKGWSACRSGRVPWRHWCRWSLSLCHATWSIANTRDCWSRWGVLPSGNCRRDSRSLLHCQWHWDSVISAFVTVSLQYICIIN